MGKGDMSLKRSDAVSKATKPLKKAKRDSETKLNPKKHKKKVESVHAVKKAKKPLKKLAKRSMSDSEKEETKKMRNSIKEMTKTMTELKEILFSKAYPPEISSSQGMKILRNSIEEMTETMKLCIRKRQRVISWKENVHEMECCFDDEDWEGNNDKTLFLKGFDTSLSRYAFVDVEDTNSALFYSETGEAPYKINVMFAKYRVEYGLYSIYGCKRCNINIPRCH